ncbi:deoxyribonuclease-4/hexulose-6-phosphate isomerase [Mumia flava]|uniref:Deoxyribonuclease-4/hexulose-6-phosphate isomerase n=1 Tax=Mumia flava TaxID=1348852 RepID=A0A0B2BQE3_9ACTN|nr:sugar phosphate isomerase/epimerase family protein [Mumia flava]PJJ58044.1 deoxyribonuclease-4/hexulose-6-phosphate isomerase [Mumia flava]
MVPDPRRAWVSTYTGLGRRELGDLLGDLAEAGCPDVEVLAAPPHLDLEHGDAPARLRSATRRAGVRVRSVVPSGVDVNLASPHAGMRAWSVAQFGAVVAIAAACDADVAVVHPGRRHPLRPAPAAQLAGWVVDGLEQVLALGDRHGVRIALENVPTGLFDTVGECRELAASFDGRLGTCLDVANAFMVEDVVAAVRDGRAAPPDLVHLSDTTRARWLHDPIGSGEVDWVAVGAALGAIGYDGPVVLETLHDGEAAAGFAADRDALAALGWGRSR